jgi:hypothetical protein
MRRNAVVLIAALCMGLPPVQAEDPPGRTAVAPPQVVEGSAALHANYEAYAAGLHVADVQAGFSLGPWSYQMALAYHTTGLVGFFYRGHQFNTVDGSWQAGKPAPHEFFGEGVWRGQDRIARIDYDHGLPLIRALVPPNQAEREPVPPALQAHSIDTLSALADLMRTVADTGRCETSVQTFDGRRATRIDAHTMGDERLTPSNRSSFSGNALRCDFSGRMLAGFLLTNDDPGDRKPLHGSAWFAQVLPREPMVPVRMAFETRWFGDATMYLTSVAPGVGIPAAPH